MSKRKPKPAPEPASRPDAPEPVAPAAAFDALCTRHADTLVRQAYLLTGRPRLARRAVERAFQQAWQRWPELSADEDPVGWVRAAAYEYALSPWHGFRPRRRLSVRAGSPEDRDLLCALLELPASYRRTLLLHDGVGLDLYETAAEVQASTPAAAGRLMHARDALAERLPELGLAGRPPVRQGQLLQARLAELAAAHETKVPAPRTVRSASARHLRWTTGAALGLTGLITAATVLTLYTAPDHYTPPPQQRPTTQASASAPAPAAQAGPDVRTGPRPRSGARAQAAKGAGKRPGGRSYLPAEARLVPGLR
ncbi:RNA polymerase sigma factor [Streptomyces sp. NPDC048638]|uniref:RNA polymerase sigma factor n=1 Tax=Streptomyces sp. NPDC048638 TaxID=3365580 RepID=UPI00371995B1